MPVTIRRARPDEWPQLEALLTSASLPLAGARDHLEHFVVAANGGSLAGCATLEPYGDVALLRSVAVDGSYRGTGIGARLVNALIDEARSRAIASLVLLTTTAAGWFPRFGFRRIDRDEVAERLAMSEELRGACPSSAVVMRLDLTPAE